MKKFFSFVAAMLFAGSMMASTPLSIDFTAGQGSWTTNDVELDGISYVWKQDSKFGMKASAYVSKTAHAAESWLISPAFSLGEASTATLKINHAVNNGAPTNFKVKASADGTNWTDLALSSWPAGSSWTFEDATADLGAFAGEEAVKIAFVYISTTELCPTWEVKTVKVEDDAEGGSGGGEGEYNYDYEPTEVTTLNLEMVAAQYTDYTAEYSIVSLVLGNDADLDNADTWAELYFVATSFDTKIPAGTYQISDSEAEGTFLASPGGDDESDIPCYVGVPASEEGYYDPYYLVSGTVTISEEGNITVNATSYNGSTINITYVAGEVPPVVPGDLATEGIHTLTPQTEETASTEGDYKVVIDGIQLEWHGAYVASDFRVFAGKDLTITAGAKIAKVEIAGKANKANSEFTVDHGTITTGASYEAVTEKATLDDPLIVVEEIGSTSVKLTCTKQLRAYTIRVTLEGAQGIEETLAEGKAVKLVRDGQVLIMKGDNTFNMMGQRVK